MSRSLWKRLVLPLALLVAVSLGVSQLWSADGFFMNLATELIGIVITVAYVDWVLRAHEAGRWRGTDARIKERLKVFGTGAISTVRTCLGYGTDVLDQAELLTGDAERGHREVLRVGKHVLAPSVRPRLEKLDPQGWKRLADQFGNLWREAERLIDRFGTRLEPAQLEALLDAQEALQGSLVFFQVFPEFAGTPLETLPQSRTPPLELREHGYDSTANHIRKVLESAARLHEA